MLDYSKLPESLRGGMRRYVEQGILPGDFLCAVLENDLIEAFKRADAINTMRMPEICRWMYREMPMRGPDYGVWGSREIVETYARAKQRESKGA